METRAPTKAQQGAVILVSCGVMALLLYAAWLSLDAGRRTPEFVSEIGLTLSSKDLREAMQIDGISLNQHFFYLVPEFRLLEDQQSFLDTHRLVWERLQQIGPYELTIGTQHLLVEQQLPSTATVLAKFGAMFIVATLFAIGAIIALWRHHNAPGRAAALFLFGASLYSLSLPALVTRSLTLPYAALEHTSDLYLLGTCAFTGLIYFPFVFNSADLKPWISRVVFWFLTLATSLFLYLYFDGRVAIASSAWFTVVCVLLFAGRIVQRAWSQMKERNVTHLVLCYAALILPTLTFSALFSWPELLAVEVSSLHYFVLTSTVVPIATISLLESELWQQRNEVQALELAAQAAQSELRSQQARQTVVMNLHDHVARSLDSISAMALRAKLSGDAESVLGRIREVAAQAHRALRGLFSISDEGCDTWPELRVQLREYGNSLVENDTVDLQLDDWVSNDANIELGASVKLICFHVVSEAVTNAVKHSQASEVRIALGANGDQFQLTVSDNGVGFDPMQVDQSQHHGLSIMRKRAQLIGANLQIASEPGVGTRVILQGPVFPPLDSAVAGQHAPTKSGDLW